MLGQLLRSHRASQVWRHFADALGHVQQLLKDMPTYPCSIRFYGHSLPPSVLYVWSALTQVHVICKRWQDAEKWMKRQESSSIEHRAMIHQIRCHFRMTAWNGFIKGFESMSEPLTTLATYASNNWLSDVHLGQMAELLSAELYNDHIHAAETLVISPYFTMLFLHNQWTHPWTQRVAEDLTTGRCACVLGVLNINNNHWIAYVQSICS